MATWTVPQKWTACNVMSKAKNFTIATSHRAASASACRWNEEGNSYKSKRQGDAALGAASALAAGATARAAVLWVW